jgi:histidinol phosphatase-like enzyme
MEEKLKLPLLMVDSKEKDGKAETMLDYVLSWCLRWAESKYLHIKPTLTQYCRYMLGLLIDENIDDSVNVKSVKVWKQWERMDLTVEVVLEKNGIESNYAILIENKYYSRIHSDQLSTYKNKFDEYYANTNWNKRYGFICCFDTREEMLDVYGEELKKNPDYVAFSFYEMLDPKYKNEQTGEYLESESDIFNEFWLNWSND